MKTSSGIAIIPAKYYSSRCPGKNWKPFHGKPMLAHSIETARESGLFSKIIVASDSDTVSTIAREYGAAPFSREPEWHDIGTQELAGKILTELGTDPNRMACVIYATAPLLRAWHLRMACEQYDEAVDTFIFSVGTAPLRDAGAFYIGLAGDFIEECPLIGPRVRLFGLEEGSVCDINTPDDLSRAEEMYAALRLARERYERRRGGA